MRAGIVVCVLGLLATSAAAQEERAAIDRSLAWLVGQQNADGSWSLQGRDGTGCDFGSTGYALLAFLRTGSNHRTGPHSKTVKAALQWLKSSQRADGGFGPTETLRAPSLRDEAIAIAAYVENAALTGSPSHWKSARAAVTYLSTLVEAADATKRLDAETTAWIVMALSSGERCGLMVTRKARERCLAHLAALTDGETGAIRATTAEAEALATAAATLGRVLAGSELRTDPALRANVAYLEQHAAHGRDTAIDPRHVHFGVLAVDRCGGTASGRWWEIKREIAGAQLAEGERAGTWTLDAEARVGSVASVAALTLALAVGRGEEARATVTRAVR